MQGGRKTIVKVFKAHGASLDLPEGRAEQHGPRGARCISWASELPRSLVAADFIGDSITLRRGE